MVFAIQVVRDELYIWKVVVFSGREEGVFLLMTCLCTYFSGVEALYIFASNRVTN